ncbi:Uu.00g019300.m01.CDS01 [Anthostomella pinea]|uniref:Uu.00g019300.m01.CDS01 n=1 Tax=Anthostomella pinea TaxID=933095 RepID=A0AAI8VTF0_9PEZI|nr:Uu.00g019300.m01.CDS01 [Anthostomella pinea]
MEIPEQIRPFYDGTFFPDHGRDHTLEEEDPEAFFVALCHVRSKGQPQLLPMCGSILFHGLSAEGLAVSQAGLQTTFERNKSKPEFVWIKDVWTEIGDGHFREIDDLIFKDSSWKPKTISPTTSQHAITINYCIPDRRCGRGLSFNIVSRLRPVNDKGRGIEDAPPNIKMNESIARLSPAGHTLVQYGSALVWPYSYKKGTPSMNDPYWRQRWSFMEPKDFTARDFRSVIDFLHTLKPNSCVVDPDRFALYRNCRIVSAVKINCNGDIARFQPFLANGISELPRFENVSVPAEVLDQNQYSAPWAEFLGLPWNVQVCHTNVDFSTQEELSNEDARFLVQDRSVMARFGQTPIPFLARPCEGSLMVMRKDGKPTHRLHVQWMTEYLEEVTAENGKRMNLLAIIMGGGATVKPGWNDFQSSWQTYLAKHKGSEEGVPDPWGLQVT